MNEQPSAPQLATPPQATPAPVTKNPTSKWKWVALALAATNVVGASLFAHVASTNHSWEKLYDEKTHENEVNKADLAIRNGNMLSCSSNSAGEIPLPSPTNGRYTTEQALDIMKEVNQDGVYCFVAVTPKTDSCSVITTEFFVTEGPVITQSSSAKRPKKRVHVTGENHAK